MSVKIGYLLPTRESIMEGRPEAEPLLNLAERAEGLGWFELLQPQIDPRKPLGQVADRTRRDRGAGPNTGARRRAGSA